MAVIDDGGMLFEFLVRPTRVTWWLTSEAIRDISSEDVKNALELTVLLPVLIDFLLGAGAVVAYTATFDLSFLPDGVRSHTASSFVFDIEAFSLRRGEC